MKAYIYGTDYAFTKLLLGNNPKQKLKDGSENRFSYNQLLQKYGI